MRKFRPLQEPIRLQDLLNSTHSRAKKKLNKFTKEGEVLALSSSRKLTIQFGQSKSSRQKLAAKVVKTELK